MACLTGCKALHEGQQLFVAVCQRVQLAKQWWQDDLHAPTSQQSRKVRWRRCQNGQSAMRRGMQVGMQAAWQGRTWPRRRRQAGWQAGSPVGRQAHRHKVGRQADQHTGIQPKRQGGGWQAVAPPSRHGWHAAGGMFHNKATVRLNCAARLRQLWLADKARRVLSCIGDGVVRAAHRLAPVSLQVGIWNAEAGANPVKAATANYHPQTHTRGWHAKRWTVCTQS